jgi:predicted transcriptional regulator
MEEKTESLEDIEKGLDDFYTTPTESNIDGRVKAFLRKTPNAYKTLIECYLKMIKRKEPSIDSDDMRKACHLELVTAERMLAKLNLLGILTREKVGISYVYRLALDEQGNP